MAVDLTSRQVRTIEWLLGHDEPASIAEMAADLRLSPRMVRSDLDGIDRFLRRHDVSLRRQRGVGVWLDAASDDREAVRDTLASLGEGGAIRVFAPRDRLILALLTLLEAAPDSLTTDQLSRKLEVSLTSARRDVARAEEWLTARGLFLVRRPGIGLSVIGSETAVRRSMVKLLLETAPGSALAGSPEPGDWWLASGISAGIRDFLRELPLAECRDIVQHNDALRVQAEGGHPWLAADLAVTVFRIRAGRELSLESGTLRSMRDHPVWDTAESLASELRDVAGGPISDDEIAGITEHLLGIAELTVDADAGAVRDDPLVREALAYAADNLHPGLAEDHELETSLTDHVQRLRVRLRYGLPVHNPLLHEVSHRYPEAHAVALHIAGMIRQHLRAPVSEDEAGFVTMYLSGAMERLRLRPRTRAIVMCPAGVATAWILVSRIQAEFPELDLVEVLSAGSVVDDQVFDADVIISTVDIGRERDGVPVLVVSPLLPDEDLRRLARLL